MKKVGSCVLYTTGTQVHVYLIPLEYIAYFYHPTYADVDVSELSERDEGFKRWKRTFDLDYRDIAEIGRYDARVTVNNLSLHLWIQNCLNNKLC